MRKNFPCRVTALTMVAMLCFSGCQAISEEAPTALTQIIPETVSAVPEETSVSTEMSEFVTTAMTESETTEKATEVEAEITETSSQTSETVSEITETTAETTSTAAETTTEAVTETTTVTSMETTVLTIQSESPPETEIITASYGTNGYNAMNYREQKGFWITYLEYGSILKNKSESSFKKSIGKYFDNISGLGFNTVYVQVRAFGDAYYDSELYPSGEQFNGTIGTSESFDALQVMIECAHDRGLSIHAWVNPMRLMTTSQIEKIDDSYPIKKWYDSDKYNGKYIVKSGDRWYLNPAYSEVTDLIASGITEIAANYDVDGIQIDDYFYPTTDASFDKSAYSASGTDSSLSDWRIANVNRMVKKLYKACHGANDSLVFGISPQGSVDNNYNQLYADVRTWCSRGGYCDYILPQVYFGFDNASLPYKDVVRQWSNMVTTSEVKLVIGLAGYKIGAVDTYAGTGGKNEWLDNDDIISRQMDYAEGLGNYGGVALYRYDSIFNPSSDTSVQVGKEMDNIEK